MLYEKRAMKLDISHPRSRVARKQSIGRTSGEHHPRPWIGSRRVRAATISEERSDPRPRRQLSEPRRTSRRHPWSRPTSSTGSRAGGRALGRRGCRRGIAGHKRIAKTVLWAVTKHHVYTD